MRMRHVRAAISEAKVRVGGIPPVTRRGKPIPSKCDVRMNKQIITKTIRQEAVHIVTNLNCQFKITVIIILRHIATLYTT